MAARPGGGARATAHSAAPGFPQRTLDAVGACTRALAAAGDADAGLESANTGSLGGLRAVADRLALRRRFHDDAVHLAHQPGGDRAATVYAALEDARLDTIGVQWLAGVAANVLAHPGAATGSLRWLAFETLSGRAAPASRTDAVTRLRRALPHDTIEQLSRLTPLLRDQSRFAAVAAEWALRHAESIPADPDEIGGPVRVGPLSRGNRRLPRRGNPGGTATALRKKTDAEREAAEGDGHATGANVDLAGDAVKYRVFTSAYDRVENAAALASRAELAELRTKLEAELSAIRPLIARLAKKLMRALMARQTRHWQFDLEEGILDGTRLAPFIASGGNARPFKQERDSPFPSTVVTLLIDHSGSMRGRPMLIAALTVEIFVRVLERCGVHCEVLGFTTRDWDGGTPAQEWAAAGYPPDPGRLNALEHIVIKSADTPWRRARLGLGLFLRDEMLKENIDGEAVAWAHGRLLTRPELRRILVVVSDGTPMDEATFAANGHEYLERHLLSVVQQIEKRSPVHLAGIGVGHDVSAFYQNATMVAKMEQLGPALSRKLIGLLQSDDRQRD
jgi:cobaltochelatase CobT